MEEQGVENEPKSKVTRQATVHVSTLKRTVSVKVGDCSGYQYMLYAGVKVVTPTSKLCSVYVNICFVDV